MAAAAITAAVLVFAVLFPPSLAASAIIIADLIVFSGIGIASGGLVVTEGFGTNFVKRGAGTGIRKVGHFDMKFEIKGTCMFTPIDYFWNNKVEVVKNACANEETSILITRGACCAGEGGVSDCDSNTPSVPEVTSGPENPSGANNTAYPKPGESTSEPLNKYNKCPPDSNFICVKNVTSNGKLHPIVNGTYVDSGEKSSATNFQERPIYIKSDACGEPVKDIFGNTTRIIHRDIKKKTLQSADTLLSGWAIEVFSEVDLAQGFEPMVIAVALDSRSNKTVFTYLNPSQVPTEDWRSDNSELDKIKEFGENFNPLQDGFTHICVTPKTGSDKKDWHGTYKLDGCSKDFWESISNVQAGVWYNSKTVDGGSIWNEDVTGYTAPYTSIYKQIKDFDGNDVSGNNKIGLFIEESQRNYSGNQGEDAIEAAKPAWKIYDETKFSPDGNWSGPSDYHAQSNFNGNLDTICKFDTQWSQTNNFKEATQISGGIAALGVLLLILFAPPAGVSAATLLVSLGVGAIGGVAVASGVGWAVGEGFGYNIVNRAKNGENGSCFFSPLDYVWDAPIKLKANGCPDDSFIAIEKGPCCDEDSRCPPASEESNSVSPGGGESSVGADGSSPGGEDSIGSSPCVPTSLASFSAICVMGHAAYTSDRKPPPPQHGSTDAAKGWGLTPKQIEFIEGCYKFSSVDSFGNVKFVNGDVSLHFNTGLGPDGTTRPEGWRIETQNNQIIAAMGKNPGDVQGVWSGFINKKPFKRFPYRLVQNKSDGYEYNSSIYLDAVKSCNNTAAPTANRRCLGLNHPNHTGADEQTFDSFSDDAVFCVKKVSSVKNERGGPTPYEIAGCYALSTKPTHRKGFCITHESDPVGVFGPLVGCYNNRNDNNFIGNLGSTASAEFSQTPDLLDDGSLPPGTFSIEWFGSANDKISIIQYLADGSKKLLTLIDSSGVGHTAFPSSADSYSSDGETFRIGDGINAPSFKMKWVRNCGGGECQENVTELEKINRFVRPQDIVNKTLSNKTPILVPKIPGMRVAPFRYCLDVQGTAFSEGHPEECKIVIAYADQHGFEVEFAAFSLSNGYPAKFSLKPFVFPFKYWDEPDKWDLIPDDFIPEKLDTTIEYEITLCEDCSRSDYTLGAGPIPAVNEFWKCENEYAPSTRTTIQERLCGPVDPRGLCVGEEGSVDEDSSLPDTYYPPPPNQEDTNQLCGDGKEATGGIYGPTADEGVKNFIEDCEKRGGNIQTISPPDLTVRKYTDEEIDYLFDEAQAGLVSRGNGVTRWEDKYNDDLEKKYYVRSVALDDDLNVLTKNDDDEQAIRDALDEINTALDKVDKKASFVKSSTKPTKGSSNFAKICIFYATPEAFVKIAEPGVDGGYAAYAGADYIIDTMGDYRKTSFTFNNDSPKTVSAHIYINTNLLVPGSQDTKCWIRRGLFEVILGQRFLRTVGKTPPDEGETILAPHPTSENFSCSQSDGTYFNLDIKMLQMIYEAVLIKGMSKTEAKNALKSLTTTDAVNAEPQYHYCCESESTKKGTYPPTKKSPGSHDGSAPVCPEGEGQPSGGIYGDESTSNKVAEFIDDCKNSGGKHIVASKDGKPDYHYCCKKYGSQPSGGGGNEGKISTTMNICADSTNAPAIKAVIGGWKYFLGCYVSGYNAPEECTPDFVLNENTCFCIKSLTSYTSDIAGCYTFQAKIGTPAAFLDKMVYSRESFRKTDITQGYVRSGAYYFKQKDENTLEVYQPQSGAYDDPLVATVTFTNGFPATFIFNNSEFSLNIVQTCSTDELCGPKLNVSDKCNDKNKTAKEKGSPWNKKAGGNYRIVYDAETWHLYGPEFNYDQDSAQGPQITPKKGKSNLYATSTDKDISDGITGFKPTKQLLNHHSEADRLSAVAFQFIRLRATGLNCCQEMEGSVSDPGAIPPEASEPPKKGDGSEGSGGGEGTSQPDTYGEKKGCNDEKFEFSIEGACGTDEIGAGIPPEPGLIDNRVPHFEKVCGGVEFGEGTNVQRINKDTINNEGVFRYTFFKAGDHDADDIASLKSCVSKLDELISKQKMGPSIVYTKPTSQYYNAANVFVIVSSRADLEGTHLPALAASQGGNLNTPGYAFPPPDHVGYASRFFDNNGNIGGGWIWINSEVVMDGGKVMSGLPAGTPIRRSFIWEEATQLIGYGNDVEKYCDGTEAEDSMFYQYKYARLGNNLDDSGNPKAAQGFSEEDIYAIKTLYKEYVTTNKPIHLVAKDIRDRENIAETNCNPEAQSQQTISANNFAPCACFEFEIAGCDSIGQEYQTHHNTDKNGGPAPAGHGTRDLVSFGSAQSPKGYHIYEDGTGHFSGLPNVSAKFDGAAYFTSVSGHERDLCWNMEDSHGGTWGKGVGPPMVRQVDGYPHTHGYGVAVSFWFKKTGTPSGLLEGVVTHCYGMGQSGEFPTNDAEYGWTGGWGVFYKDGKLFFVVTNKTNNDGSGHGNEYVSVPKKAAGTQYGYIDARYEWTHYFFWHNSNDKVANEAEGGLGTNGIIGLHHRNTTNIVAVDGVQDTVVFAEWAEFIIGANKYKDKLSPLSHAEIDLVKVWDNVAEKSKMIEIAENDYNNGEGKCCSKGISACTGEAYDASSREANTATDSGPQAVNGHYPVYEDDSFARMASPKNESKQITLNDKTYYMPEGLVLGDTIFMGDYAPN